MTTWSQDAAIELRALTDALAGARDRLVAAAADGWVSPAGERYDAELAEQRAALSRLLASCEAGRDDVLRHTNAADDCTRAGSWCA